MALEIRQVQKLTQQLVMTPQLQQAIKLLQLSRVELEEMVTKELQENPALEEGPTEEAEASGEQPRSETQASVPENSSELVLNRELSAVDKIGTLDWQEYLDTHSNSIHGSLTAEATSDDGDSPPSWENSLTKKTTLEDHLIWQLRLSKITEREIDHRLVRDSKSRPEWLSGSQPGGDLYRHGKQRGGSRSGAPAHSLFRSGRCRRAGSA